MGVKFGKGCVVDGISGFVVEEGQVGVVDNLGRTQDELAGVSLHVPNADGLVTRTGNDFVSVSR